MGVADCPQNTRQMQFQSTTNHFLAGVIQICNHKAVGNCKNFILSKLVTHIYILGNCDLICDASMKDSIKYL
jgi:hypothetical protein